jgi:hypothetical protein
MNHVHTLSVKVFSQSMVDDEHRDVKVVDQIEVDVTLMLFICVEILWKVRRRRIERRTTGHEIMMEAHFDFT